MLQRLTIFLNSGSERSAIVKKNILASFGIKGISMIVSFALVPLTIGYVSSELYVGWLTLSSILTWLCFLDIGFSQGLKNKLTETIAHEDWDKGKSLVSTTYFMMILIFVPICVLLELLIPHINWCNLLNVNPIYESEIVQVMSVLIVFACLQMVVNVFVSVVAAFQKVALSNSFAVIGNVISLIIIFVLTKTCPPSLLSLAFSLAAMPIAVTIIASIILFTHSFKRVALSFKSIRKDYIKELLGLGYKFFIINIQVLVLYQSTNVLISNVSSPNEVTTYNIAYKLLNAAEEGKKTFPFTTGKNKYDFINVDELAHLISTAVMQSEVTGIINVCKGQPISLAERVENFIKEHNLDIKLEYGAFPDCPYDSPCEYGDPTKINQILAKQ